MIVRFDGKNWAIGFLIAFDLLFLALSIVFRIDPKTPDLGKDLWGIFLMANGGLFLILNSAGKAQAGIDPPPGTDPSKQVVTQTVESKTTTTPAETATTDTSTVKVVPTPDPTQVPPKAGV